MYQQGDGWRMELGPSEHNEQWLSLALVPTREAAQRIQEMISLAHALGHKRGWDSAREEAGHAIHEALG